MRKRNRGGPTNLNGGAGLEQRLMHARAWGREEDGAKKLERDGRRDRR